MEITFWFWSCFVELSFPIICSSEALPRNYSTNSSKCSRGVLFFRVNSRDAFFLLSPSYLSAPSQDEDPGRRSSRAERSSISTTFGPEPLPLLMIRHLLDDDKTTLRPALPLAFMSDPPNQTSTASFVLLEAIHSFLFLFFFGLGCGASLRAESET